MPIFSLIRKLDKCICLLFMQINYKRRMFGIYTQFGLSSKYSCNKNCTIPNFINLISNRANFAVRGPTSFTIFFRGGFPWWQISTSTCQIMLTNCQFFRLTCQLIMSICQLIIFKGGFLWWQNSSTTCRLIMSTCHLFVLSVTKNPHCLKLTQYLIFQECYYP